MLQSVNLKSNFRKLDTLMDVLVTNSHQNCWRTAGYAGFERQGHGLG